jgi:hypothetical protein
MKGARVRRFLIVVVAVGLVGVSAAAAASPAPDAHDRAVAQQLAAKVVELQKLVTASKGSDDRITKALRGCKGLGKTPGESFGVVFAMLPVLLIDVVNELRPQLLDLRATIGPMHPHALLFRRWLAAERANIDQILAFDNHGKKIDYCAAAKVMLAKNPSDAQVEAVLGVPPSRIKALFAGASSQASATVSKLNSKMRTFLIAAGVPRKVAVQLTK